MASVDCASRPMTMTVRHPEYQWRLDADSDASSLSYVYDSVQSTRGDDGVTKEPEEIQDPCRQEMEQGSSTHDK